MNENEAKSIIREILEKGLEGEENQTINHGGEQINISREDGIMRFDLMISQESYILKSGRLYKREFKFEPAPEEEENPIKIQMNYNGGTEQIDTRMYSHKISCSCGDTRWVKKADLFQVNQCKPCTVKARAERRKTSRFLRQNSKK